MEQLRILFATCECVPFIKTGGLGDVAGSLPAALNAAGCDCRVILPKHGAIPQQYRDAMEPVCTFTVPLSWRMQYCGLEQLVLDGVTYYFLDNEYYFKRERPYGYFDDAERMAFFSKAIVEAMQYLPGFFPNVLHCNDWHTALAPVYLREEYFTTEQYRSVRIVMTVHNLKYQGVFSDSVLGNVLGLEQYPSAADQLRWQGGAVNFLQAGLRYADRLSVVSPTYAEEVCTAYYGEGLDSLFRERHSILHGILNGIDPHQFDPQTDPSIPSHFSAQDPGGKTACKLALQQELGLTVNASIPMLVLISRLVEQKGLDLLTFMLEELLREDLQLVICGVGDEKYESAFRYWAGQLPQKLSANILFSEPFSHKLYAAGDLLLMPSQFEPCGLSQMICMRYGTLPLVRETGGLKDSVIPYNQYTGEGNGFSFANYNAHELLHCIQYAAGIYRSEPEHWAALQQHAFAADFSWARSAQQYIDMYRALFA